MLSNIEMYTTPEGDVMIKPLGEPVRRLEERDRDFISSMLTILLDRYPKAVKALMGLYSKSEVNKWYCEFLVVHRFIRCNFGAYDALNPDIDHAGRFMFESVPCPLRGECPFEGIICKPELNTMLTEREKAVFRLIVRNLRTDAIADELHISPCTVNRHRENIKAKISASNVGEMINYWHAHNLK
jgi:DNA-binding CsgD family transcriptional regulator